MFCCCLLKCNMILFSCDSINNSSNIYALAIKMENSNELIEVQWIYRSPIWYSIFKTSSHCKLILKHNNIIYVYSKRLKCWFNYSWLYKTHFLYGIRRVHLIENSPESKINNLEYICIYCMHVLTRFITKIVKRDHHDNLRQI